MAYTNQTAYSTQAPVKSGPLGRLADLKTIERSYGIYQEADKNTVSYPSAGNDIRVLDPMDTTDSGAARIVAGLRGLFRARTMEEHCSTMGLFARDLVWDAPPILMGRKGHLRVAAYLAKFAGELDMVPDAVKVHRLPGGRHVVEIIGTYAVYPKRTWLVWPTLLLPHSVPIKATIKLGVNGPLETGQVEMLWGRVHNAPVLPSIVRAANGVAMGVLPHTFEPVWGWAADLWGDNWYSQKRHRQWKNRHPESGGMYDRTVDTASDVTENTIDYASDVVKSLQGYVYYVLEQVWGVARYAADTGAKAVGTVAGVAGAAAQGAVDVAQGATNVALKTTGAIYGTAASVGHTVYDTAAPIAGAAVDTAANVAYQAKDTAAYAAQRTVNAAADTANAAYGVAADTANAAYDTAANTANATYNTAANAASATYSTAADTANTAYYKTAETAGAVKGAAVDSANRAADNTTYAAQRTKDTTAYAYDNTKAAAANAVNAIAGGVAGAAQGAKVGAQAGQRMPYTDVPAAANTGAAAVGKVGTNTRY